MYAYINDNDRVNWRKVKNSNLQELFDEAFEIDKSLMIVEHEYEVPRFLRKPLKFIEYSIYHEVFFENGNPMYQARLQISAEGNERHVSAYLYGIINGSRLK